MKFDANGNMLLSKLFADPNQTTLNLSFLQTVSITVIEDTDIAINGRVLSSSSSINYSNNSSTDQVVFRISQTGGTLWVTILDYKLGYDSTNKMISYGSTIYSGMYANRLYPWFFSLNGTSGGYLLSNWYTFFFNNINDDIGNWDLKLYRFKMQICDSKLCLLVRTSLNLKEVKSKLNKNSTIKLRIKLANTHYNTINFLDLKNCWL